MSMSRKMLRTLMPDALPGKIGQKNRLYLPKEVAEALGIKPGDFVIIRIAGSKATIEKLK